MTDATAEDTPKIDSELIRLHRRLQELRAIREIVSDRRTLMPDDYDEAFTLLVASETRYRRLPRVEILRQFDGWCDRWRDVGREYTQTKLFGFIDGALDSASRRFLRRIDDRRFIFFNYRVADAYDQVMLMYEGITRRFGAIASFLDNRDIKLASDFEFQIVEKLNSVRVFLVCIGPRWNITSQSKQSDWVVREIRHALDREKAYRDGTGDPLNILPVLLNGTRMPREDELPVTIKELGSRQGVYLNPDERFVLDPSALANPIVEIILRQVTEPPTKAEVGS